MARPEAKDVLRLYSDAKTIRRPLEPDWKMCAAYCLPRHYSQWQTEGPASQFGNTNQAVKRYAYDNTGVKSLPKYVSILNRIMTPDNQRWARLAASDPQLMKSYNVKLYFDRLNDELFKRRYAPRARFTQAQSEVYAGLGVYGMGPKSITWRKPTPLDRDGGFAYKAWPLKDVFILTDDAGNVVCVFRRFWLNVRQFKIKFPEAPMPTAMSAEAGKPVPSETRFFEFVHVMCERDMADYDAKAIGVRRHPVCAYYISVEGAEYVGDEQGFQGMPLLTPRTFTEPGELYGYSPAQQALPALGGVSSMKKTVLKQGHKAVDPPLLAADDGVLSGRVDMRPSHVNYGAVNSQGQKLIHTLDSNANFQVAETLLADERHDIEDCFFVTIFQILSESSEMTATEVVERIAQQASLLAPTMGRLQSEDLGPSHEREIALLAENGILSDRYGLEMPPELVEARGDYKIVYASPMAKGQYTEDVAGFMRWLEMNLKYAEATKDPAALDWINMDAANPEIAEVLSVRTGWVCDTKTVEIKRKNRESQASDQQMMDQAPAMASVVNTLLKSKANGSVPGVAS